MTSGSGAEAFFDLVQLFLDLGGLCFRPSRAFWGTKEVLFGPWGFPFDLGRHGGVSFRSSLFPLQPPWAGRKAWLVLACLRLLACACLLVPACLCLLACSCPWGAFFDLGVLGAGALRRPFLTLGVFSTVGGFFSTLEGFFGGPGVFCALASLCLLPCACLLVLACSCFLARAFLLVRACFLALACVCLLACAGACFLVLASLRLLACACLLWLACLCLLVVLACAGKLVFGPWGAFFDLGVFGADALRRLFGDLGREASP